MPTKKAAQSDYARALAALRTATAKWEGVVETTNHSAPAFTVKKKTFAMLWDNHHGDGRVALWCKAPPGMQAMLVESDPERFFVPPYVGPKGWLGIRLDKGLSNAEVLELVYACYEASAPANKPPRAAKKIAKKPQNKAKRVR